MLQAVGRGRAKKTVQVMTHDHDVVVLYAAFSGHLFSGCPTLSSSARLNVHTVMVHEV